MVSGNWLFCLALIVRLCFNLFHVNAEEAVLEEQFGGLYVEYLRITPGMLPGPCCLESIPQRIQTEEPHSVASPSHPALSAYRYESVGGYEPHSDLERASIGVHQLPPML